MTTPNKDDKALAVRATFKNMIESLKPSIAAVLPQHLTPERMCKIVLVAATRTPLLYQCSRETLCTAIMTASQLGLDCGGALGSAYLLPYRNKRTGGYDCQLIIGYRGMIDLARRSGQIASISCRAVFKADRFRLVFGDDEKIEHEPDREAASGPDQFEGAYLIARFVGGGIYREWMSKAEIDEVRAQSKAGDSGPWVTHYLEMAKKTVVRRAFKMLPMSIEVLASLADTAATSRVGADAVADIIDTVATAEDETAPADSPPPGEGGGAAATIRRLQAKAAETPEEAPSPPAKSARGAKPKAEEQAPTDISMDDIDAMFDREVGQ